MESRRRLVGYGIAGALALACVAVGLVLALGGGDSDSGGSPGGASLFPKGGSVPEQQVLDMQPASSAASCDLRNTPSRGESDRIHTNGPGVKVKYRGNPPTLGPHWPAGYQAEDGLYREAPADEALVHTMEHGRVIFWVKPSLPVDARKSLRALFDQDSYQLVMVPRSAMPYAVAATTWNADPRPGGTGRTLACPRWSNHVIDALRIFRDDNRAQGPEPVP